MFGLQREQEECDNVFENEPRPFAQKPALLQPNNKREAAQALFVEATNIFGLGQTQLLRVRLDEYVRTIASNVTQPTTLVNILGANIKTLLNHGLNGLQALCAEQLTCLKDALVAKNIESIVPVIEKILKKTDLSAEQAVLKYMHRCVVNEFLKPLLDAGLSGGDFKTVQNALSLAGCLVGEIVAEDVYMNMQFYCINSIKPIGATQKDILQMEPEKQVALVDAYLKSLDEAEQQNMQMVLIRFIAFQPKQDSILFQFLSLLLTEASGIFLLLHFKLIDTQEATSKVCEPLAFQELGDDVLSNMSTAVNPSQLIQALFGTMEVARLRYGISEHVDPFLQTLSRMFTLLGPVRTAHFFNGLMQMGILDGGVVKRIVLEVFSRGWPISYTAPVFVALVQYGYICVCDVLGSSPPDFQQFLAGVTTQSVKRSYYQTMYRLVAQNALSEAEARLNSQLVEKLDFQAVHYSVYDYVAEPEFAELGESHLSVFENAALGALRQLFFGPRQTPKNPEELEKIAKLVDPESLFVNVVRFPPGVHLFEFKEAWALNTKFKAAIPALRQALRRMGNPKEAKAVAKASKPLIARHLVDEIVEQVYNGQITEEFALQALQLFLDAHKVDQYRLQQVLLEQIVSGDVWLGGFVKSW